MLTKNSNAEDITISGFKLHCRAVAIKIVMVLAQKQA
jgi:hypothetical protein